MNIQTAQYYNMEGETAGIQVTLQGIDEILCVPIDLSNRHYAEIMRQVEAGELTIQDAD
tara:strand:- start:311 stop:487 length:177 start_codon:yes stop_codon:yes gene_type:complete